jgi:hypothetical protein
MNKKSMGLWVVLLASVVGVSSGFCCRSQVIAIDTEVVPAEDITEVRMYVELAFEDIVSKQFGISHSLSGVLAQRRFNALDVRSVMPQHEWLKKALIACDVWYKALIDKIACCCMESGSLLVQPPLVVEGVIIFQKRELDMVQTAKRYDVLKLLHMIRQ